MCTMIIILHFLFDWILQPRHIAKAKGQTREGISAVAQHMILNIFPFSIFFALILLGMDFTFKFTFIAVLINFVSHALIDIYLPKGRNEREMINWTAIDQILHISILFYILSQ